MTDVARLAAETPREELPKLIGELEQARAIAWSRLSAPVSQQPAAERLVDAVELAGLINRPAWSVRDLARRGVIPTVRIGRLLKFRPSAVLQALEGGEHRTSNHVRAEKRRQRKGECPSGVRANERRRES